MPPIHEVNTTSESATFPTIPLRSQESFEDDIVERLSYHRCDDDSNSDSETPGLLCTDAMMYADAVLCAENAQESCSRFVSFQERYLGPISPERAPAIWMVLNGLCLSWSLILGIYLTVLCVDQDKETTLITTEYLLYSLITTLVWVAEIYLRTAYPPVETIVVVSNPTVDDGGEKGVLQHGTREESEAECQMQGISRTFTAEESVVTVETVVQRRNNKQFSALCVELLLALFFAIESVIDCWKHWNHLRGNYEASQYMGDDGDDYYMFDEDGETYSMLQQQTDVWINFLAYAYMTYHTYHEYYKAAKNRTHVQKSLSSTLLDQYDINTQQQGSSPARRVYAQPQVQGTSTNATVIVRSSIPQEQTPPITSSSSRTGSSASATTSTSSGRVTLELTSSSVEGNVGLNPTTTQSPVNNPEDRSC